MYAPNKTFTIVESEAEETARLAQASVGSEQCFWSTLPVTIYRPLYGLLIELPSEHGERTVVVVNDNAPACDPHNPYTGPMRLDSDYTCVVVTSTNESYPVGNGENYTITVNSAALRRGRLITV